MRNPYTHSSYDRHARMSWEERQEEYAAFLRRQDWLDEKACYDAEIERDIRLTDGEE